MTTSAEGQDAPSKGTISASLIVRDEAHNLTDCVASLRALGHLLREVVVVDTGSRDDTLSIAHELGCRVAEKPWTNDFSHARNASLSLCRAEWVLAIDADERLVAGPDAPDLIQAGDPSTDAYVLSLVSTSSDGLDSAPVAAAKLFRRGRMQWEGAVHEQVRRIDGRAPTLVDVPASLLSFRHLGYADGAQRRRKAARNAAVANLSIARLESGGPSTELARALLHRGRSKTLSDPSNALADLEQAWIMAAPGDGVCELAGEALLTELLSSGKAAEAMAVAQTASRRGVAERRVRWWTVLVLAGVGRIDQALAQLEMVQAAEPAGGPSDETLTVWRIDTLVRADRRDEALAAAILAVASGRREASRRLLSLWGDQPPSLLAALIDEVGGASAACVALSATGERSVPVLAALAERRVT